MLLIFGSQTSSRIPECRRGACSDLISRTPCTLRYLPGMCKNEVPSCIRQAERSLAGSVAPKWGRFLCFCMFGRGVVIHLPSSMRVDDENTKVDGLKPV